MTPGRLRTFPAQGFTHIGTSGITGKDEKTADKHEKTADKHEKPMCDVCCSTNRKHNEETWQNARAWEYAQAHEGARDARGAFFLF